MTLVFSTVQFYLQLGCDSTPPDPASPSVYAQYSTNGGINWYTIEQFDFNENSNKPTYMVLNLPEKARSTASQLRWWQPSENGTFSELWAIDEVWYIVIMVTLTIVMNNKKVFTLYILQ